MPYSRIYDNYRYTSDTFGDTFFANLYYLKSYSFEKNTKYIQIDIQSVVSSIDNINVYPYFVSYYFFSNTEFNESLANSIFQPGQYSGSLELQSLKKWLLYQFISFYSILVKFYANWVLFPIFRVCFIIRWQYFPFLSLFTV